MQDLGALFAPRHIAIIGASADSTRSGARVLQALTATGFEGRIHLVTRSHTVIGDRICFRSIADVPETIDLAAVCVSAANAAEVIRQCGRAGVRSAIVYADGFEDETLRRELADALAEAQSLCGLRMLGPNTLGIRNSASWTYATFSWRPKGRLSTGPVATITQSGGIGSVFGKAMLRRRGLGPRYVIDTGSEFDVDAAEAIEYVATDREVACISVTIEGCRDGNRLASAVRHARAQGKPVVFLKSGRSQAAIKQVASHTGALAGSAEVFDTILREAGACVVQDEGELIDAVTLHSFGHVPKGRGLGVVTPSGGYGILTIDAAERYDMDLPHPSLPLSGEDRLQFPDGKQTNPFDMSAGVGSSAQRWAVAARWMGSQPEVDAILMWQAAILDDEDEREKTYPVLAELARESDKPIFCCGLTTPEYEDKLRQAGILMFQEPTRLVKAIALVAPVRTIGRSAPVKTHTIAQKHIITGARARSVLANLPELPHAPTVVVASAREALQAQKELAADKIILKVEGNRVAHKSDLGMVSPPLTEGEVSTAFAELDRTRTALGDANAPIVLQPFISGTELALGGYVDPVFGPVIMVALGGIYLEILRDTSFARAPVTQAKAQEMILSLKGAGILRGARGKPIADMAAITRGVAAFSRFFLEHYTQYSEIDVNPLIAHKSGRGITAVDVMLVEKN